MKTVVSSLLLCIVLALCPTRAFSAADEPQEGAAKTTFLVIYRPSPAWPAGTPVSELPLKEHWRYMLGLFEKGSMKFAGPLTDDAGGAVVLEVVGQSEAMAIVAGDPAVKAGIFVHEIHPWKLVPWAEHARKQVRR